MSFVIFAALVAAAAFTGAQFEPGEWYAQAAKPSWTPPNWVFAPVWTALYVAIAIAGWQVWRSAGAKWVPALSVWLLQLVLNSSWSWLFFGIHRPGLALIDLTLLLATIIVFIALALRHSRLASGLFVPYLLWVGFAGALNLSIVLLN